MAFLLRQEASSCSWTQSRNCRVSVPSYTRYIPYSRGFGSSETCDLVFSRRGVCLGVIRPMVCRPLAMGQLDLSFFSQTFWKKGLAYIELAR